MRNVLLLTLIGVWLLSPIVGLAGVIRVARDPVCCAPVRVHLLPLCLFVWIVV